MKGLLIGLKLGNKILGKFIFPVESKQKKEFLTYVINSIKTLHNE